MKIDDDEVHHSDTQSELHQAIQGTAFVIDTLMNKRQTLAIAHKADQDASAPSNSKSKDKTANPD